MGRKEMKSTRRFLSRWQNCLAIALIAFFVFVALSAPILSPDDPKHPGAIKIVGRSTQLEPQPPSKAEPFGTLTKQVSVYHAVVWGTRSALVFGLIVTIIVAIIGVIIGTVSAYFGGFLSGLLMRITDAFLAFPVIAGVVLFQQLISINLYNAGLRFFNGATFMVNASGNFIDFPDKMPLFLNILQKLDPVQIALIVFCWVPYARIMHTTVLRITTTQYVQAARVSGSGHLKIMFRHLLPNSIAPVIVLAAKDVGAMVVLQAAFYFIGFGNGSPWAMILVRGRDWIYNPGGILTFWWVFLPATLAMVLFGISWNLLGDGLNDALNPRMR
jgi:peptide/nickel transport system permease protein